MTSETQMILALWGEKEPQRNEGIVTKPLP
jgi:hypothetical protein